MSEQKGIYWLASYPKSGNTWFRVFLAHMLHDGDDALDLDGIRTGAIASGRAWVDEALGFDSAHFTHDDLDALRPAVYRWHAEQATTVEHHKTHDAYTYLPNGEALIPAQNSLGALYFVRNPLDVAVSFANHMNCSIDQAIQSMGKPDFAFCKSNQKLHDQLRQQLLSWSMHVKSWSEAQEINCLVLRYEDMKQTPMETFTRAAKHLKLDASEERIERALNHAHIDRLQDLEQAHGFKEKPPKVERFFRKGMVGDWKNVLTSKQIDTIIHDHGEVMQAHGYI
ncbi:MAG: sulfotransferase domain-containing protein [Legionella sp.]|jgi:hypothetical protein|nr:sulfotransferase domain-containing protein [Legionella sp.]